MKKQIKIIVSILILYAFSLSLFACSNSEKYPEGPVEAGLESSSMKNACVPDRSGENLFCGYKLETNVYELGKSIPVTLYYGVPTYRQPYDYEDPNNVIISVYNAKKADEALIYRETTIGELYEENSLADDIEEEAENDTILIRTIYNHSEKREIPSEMFIGEKGTIIFEIEHLDVRPQVFCYGWNSQSLYYRIENGMIYLSSEYSLISG